MPDDNIRNVWVGSSSYFVINSVQYIFLIDLHIIVPDSRMCCWFVESSVLFRYFTQNTIHFWYIPHGSTVAFTTSIFLHPRSSRMCVTCAEPRWASSRRVEAPLVDICMVRAAKNLHYFFSAQVPVSPGRTVCLIQEKHHWKAHPNAERSIVFL